MEIAVLCAMFVSDDQEEAWDACRWAAACAREPHRRRTQQLEPDHGMPEELTRLVDARTQHYDYYAGHLDSSASHAESDRTS